MEGHFLPVDEVQRASDIVQIISEYISLKRAGKNYKALCPFHQEKTPSFIVSPDKQLFHCFGCGEGGNVFTFVQKMEKLSFPDAVKFLAKKAGIVLREHTPSYTDTLFEINNFSCQYFQKKLKDKIGRNIYEHLKEKRGLTDETIEKFKIGYSPQRDELFTLLKGKFKIDDIERSGIFIKKDSYYNIFRGRIIFPLFDTLGRVVGFSGRSVTGDEPKYINSPETSIFRKGEMLYGLNFTKHYISEKGYAIVVEGYLDMISLYQYGILNCVASMGTGFSLSQADALSKFTQSVVVCFDPDEAGMSAAERMMEILYEKNFKIRVVVLPKGEDPDTLVRKTGKDGFEKFLKASKSYFQHRIDKIISNSQIQTPEDRAELINKICTILQKIKNPVVLDSYIKIISRDIKVDEKLIRSSLHFLSSQNKFNIYYRKPFTDFEKIERDFLKVILNKPSYLLYVLDKISPSDFTTKAPREIFKVLLEIDVSNTSDLHMRVYSACPDDIKNYFTSLINEEDIPKVNKDDIEVWIRRIKSRALREKIKEIRKEIEEAEKQKNTEYSLHLAQTILSLEKELRKL